MRLPSNKTLCTRRALLCNGLEKATGQHWHRRDEAIVHLTRCSRCGPVLVPLDTQPGPVCSIRTHATCAAGREEGGSHEAGRTIHRSKVTHRPAAGDDL